MRRHAPVPGSAGRSRVEGCGNRSKSLPCHSRCRGADYALATFIGRAGSAHDRARLREHCAGRGRERRERDRTMSQVPRRVAFRGRARASALPRGPHGRTQARPCGADEMGEDSTRESSADARAVAPHASELAGWSELLVGSHLLSRCSRSDLSGQQQLGDWSGLRCDSSRSREERACVWYSYVLSARLRSPRRPRANETPRRAAI
jgi:hypothetical protein